MNRTITKTKAATGGVGGQRATTGRANTIPAPVGQASKKGTTRKPFVDRNASPEGKGRVAQGAKSSGKAVLAKSASGLNVVLDNDREPIRVRSLLNSRTIPD